MGTWSPLASFFLSTSCWRAQDRFLASAGTRSLPPSRQDPQGASTKFIPVFRSLFPFRLTSSFLHLLNSLLLPLHLLPLLRRRRSHLLLTRDEHLPEHLHPLNCRRRPPHPTRRGRRSRIDDWRRDGHGRHVLPRLSSSSAAAVVVVVDDDEVAGSVRGDDRPGEVTRVGGRDVPKGAMKGEEGGWEGDESGEVAAREIRDQQCR